MAFYSTLNSFMNQTDRPPLSEQAPLDIDKIEELVEELNTPQSSSGTQIYNLGLEYFNAFSNNVYGFVDERVFTPQPSLSYQMINHSTPLMVNWLNDPNSMELVARESGELVREEVETKVRGELHDTKLMLAIQKMFLDGMSLICCSPYDSAVWIPDAEDVSVDWTNMDFFAAKRKIIEGDNEEEITQGCFMQHDQWFEFELRGNEGEIWTVDRPTMVPFIYTISPSSRMPMGIPQALSALEKNKWAAERAIYQILQRTAGVSLLVGGGFDNNIINSFYRNKVIPIQTKPGEDLRNNIFPVPSRVEEIPALANEIERITDQAIRQCGLTVMRGPNDVQASVSTFAEQTAYEASTVTMRNIVERCLQQMSIIFDNILERRTGTNDIQCKITHNPLDAIEERNAIEKILPGIEATLKEDPDNIQSLGLIRLEELGKIYERYFRLNKLNDSLLAPKQVRISAELARGILTDRAAQKEQDAATLIAIAEIEKSKAQLQNSEVNNYKAQVDAEKKLNDAHLALERLKIENFSAIAKKNEAEIKSIKDLAASFADLEGNGDAQAKVAKEIVESLNRL